MNSPCFVVEGAQYLAFAVAIQCARGIANREFRTVVIVATTRDGQPAFEHRVDPDMGAMLPAF